jgi:O-antigen ligase
MPGMVKLPLVRHAALFWGLMLFMPVGMNYLAALLLMVALLLEGQARVRWRRVRKHPLWWPGVVFTGWNLLVLALQPVWFTETPANLFHGLRIVATLALALALSRDEAVASLKGFLVGAAVALAVVLVHLAVGLPRWDAWEGLIRHDGNKAVSNAVLFASLAAGLLTLAVTHAGRVRWGALLGAAALSAALVLVLPSRTAMLIVVVALLGASVHRWRGQPLRLGAALAAVTLGAALGLATLPGVRDRVQHGISELRQAQAGDISKASWGIRYHMLQQTARMVQERPWTGWGIGSWNTQWKQRMPAPFWGFNMPHNDFLWAGAQAGVPGALALLALVLAAVRQGWQRRDLTGRLGLLAGLTLLLAASTNSAMRDAAIGLSLLWLVGLVMRLQTEPSDVVAAALPLGAGRQNQ